MMEQHRNSLQPGYQLHWYVLKQILGQGGFGITYLAHDTNLNQEVAIKEYLPVELAVRDGDHSIHPVSGEHGEQFSWGLDRFMSEAQTLAQFKHPNIVRVLTVFPENNSAYMVMEYEQGQAMHELLKKEKTLSEERIRQIILPILDGLEQIHQAGFIHRDIKPPNIFIREDGSPVLLDFGSARQSLGEKTHTLTSMVSPGFAPFEQYVSKSDKQGPWTDVYGLAATMYRAVIGRSPSEAMDRSEALLHTQRDSYVGAVEIAPPGYSLPLLQAIDSGMAFKVEDRPASVIEWRRQIMGESSATEVLTAVTEENTLKHAQQPDTAVAEKITIRADVDRTQTEVTAQQSSSAWYRKPLKVIAVLFGIILLLAILGDDKKDKDAQQNVEQGDVASAGVMMDQLDKEAGDTPDTKADVTASDVSSSPKVSDSPGANVDSTTEAPETPSTDAAGDLIEKSDRRLLERIRRQLESDPQSPQARRSLRKLTDKYEGRLKQAIKEKNFDLAEAYVDAMLKVSPESEKLKEAAARIKERKKVDGK